MCYVEKSRRSHGQHFICVTKNNQSDFGFTEPHITFETSHLLFYRLLLYCRTLRQAVHVDTLQTFMRFLIFTLWFYGCTTWFGNVYGQSHSSRILVHLSKHGVPHVVLSFTNTKHPDTRPELVTLRDFALGLPMHGIVLPDLHRNTVYA